MFLTNKILTNKVLKVLKYLNKTKSLNYNKLKLKAYIIINLF